MRLFLGWPDEGLLVAGAARIAHGQVFARDFIEIMGPGTFYWLALFFKLFGVTFLATRICLFVSSLGTGLLLYFLSRRICDRYQILPPILLAGTYFGGLWPTISHHVDSNFFALLSVALIRGLAREAEFLSTGCCRGLCGSHHMHPSAKGSAAAGCPTPLALDAVSAPGGFFIFPRSGVRRLHKRSGIGSRLLLEPACSLGSGVCEFRLAISALWRGKCGSLCARSRPCLLERLGRNRAQRGMENRTCSATDFASGPDCGAAGTRADSRPWF